MEDAVAPAHAGAVRIAAQRSCSNGLPAPPSHQSRLAEPAGYRLLVLVIAMGPCAGEEEQKTTTDVVVDVHIAHLAGCSPAGIGTRRVTAGCRASKGRFPPPLWMSAGLHSLVDGDNNRRVPPVSRGICEICDDRRSDPPRTLPPSLPPTSRTITSSAGARVGQPAAVEVRRGWY